MEVGKKHIEWARQSINPITGCNGPNGVRCEYCYAERIANRFKDVHGYPKPDPFVPAFHPHRLEKIKKRKKATIYFFGSMCDWLDDGVKPEWRQKCLEVMAENPHHVFITLTKQYKNLWKIAYDSPEGVIPPNVWVGITVSERSQVWGIEELKNRAGGSGLENVSVRFVSFEPLKEDLANIVDLTGIDWMIIGAQTRQAGVGELPAVPGFMPERAWVKKLVYKTLQREVGSPEPWTKVFLKPNLGDYVAKGWFTEKIEQMPEVR
jgi:protein gp37